MTLKNEMTHFDFRSCINIRCVLENFGTISHFGAIRKALIWSVN